mmetsp:Transcript_51351/g.134977  ORF Transcript_51351/g.134977 Transcript_51351/m.134977 type:complete len:102 (+) Transcript_51351:52-357(+)
MWKGSGRSLFKTLILENFKFTLFVVTPIVTAGIFQSDMAVEFLVRNRQYVSYPAEQTRPLPTNDEELRAAQADIRARLAAAGATGSATGRRGGTLTPAEDK